MRHSEWLKIRLQKAQNTVRLLKKDIRIEELTTELENTVEQLSRTQKGFCSDVRGMQEEYSRKIAELERDNAELKQALEVSSRRTEKLLEELETKPFGVLRSESVVEESHPELILTPNNDFVWDKTQSSQHSQVSTLDRDPKFIQLLDFEESTPETPETPKGWDSV